METITVSEGWAIIKVGDRSADAVVKETETLDLPTYYANWLVRLGAGTV